MEHDMVFEGGGAKGIVFVGAMQVLEQRGIKPRRLVGTSAGAITAALLAAHYNADQLLAAVAERGPDGRPVFASFLDIPEEDSFDPEAVEDSLTFQLLTRIDLPGIPEMLEKRLDRFTFDRLMKLKVYREIFSLVEKGGLYSGETFRRWITAKLEAQQPGLGAAGFAEFHAKTGSDLSVLATDTSSQQMLVLNHRTAPECPVAWALRMSISIPFVWQEVAWRAEWGRYLGTDLSDHIIVDGGTLSNFPLRLVTSDDPDVVDVMGTTDPAGAGTLGLLIDETLAVADAPPREPAKGSARVEGELLDSISHLRTVGRIMRLVDTLTSAHDRSAIDAYPQDVCQLPAQGYGTTEFDMSEARRDALIRAAANATRSYLDARPA